MVIFDVSLAVVESEFVSEPVSVPAVEDEDEASLLAGVGVDVGVDTNAVEVEARSDW